MGRDPSIGTGARAPQPAGAGQDEAPVREGRADDGPARADSINRVSGLVPDTPVIRMKEPAEGRIVDLTDI